MKGHLVARKGGWDTHGLPVEIEVEKKLGIQGKEQIEEFGLAEVQRPCRKSVFTYKDEWDRITERIGFWLDLEHPVRHARQRLHRDGLVAPAAQFWDEGLFYAGFKIVPYCPRCETPLSEPRGEPGLRGRSGPLGHREVRARGRAGRLHPGLDDDPLDAVPATWRWRSARRRSPTSRCGRRGREGLLPGRRAPRPVLRGEILKSSARAAARECSSAPLPPLFSAKVPPDRRDAPRSGSTSPRSPAENAYYVTDADFVIDGRRHRHRAHGARLRRGRLPRSAGSIDLPPVPHRSTRTGDFTAEVPPVRRPVREGRRSEDHRSTCASSGQRSTPAARPHEHTYPFCWRCALAAPLLRARLVVPAHDRATATRCSPSNARGRAGFRPRWGRTASANWLENNVDWAISRDRYWGTPLPLWRCEGCGEDRLRREPRGARGRAAARPGRARPPPPLHRPGHARLPGVRRATMQARPRGDRRLVRLGRPCRSRSGTTRSSDQRTSSRRCTRPTSSPRGSTRPAAGSTSLLAIVGLRYRKEPVRTRGRQRPDARRRRAEDVEAPGEHGRPLGQFWRRRAPTRPLVPHGQFAALAADPLRAGGRHRGGPEVPGTLRNMAGFFALLRQRGRLGAAGVHPPGRWPTGRSSTAGSSRGSTD